jgi:DNA polymerase elongation subunit (family B)
MSKTKQELIDKINELKAEKQKLKDLANVQDLRQHAFKIFLNSSYGALGSAFYPCFDLDNAEAVTLSGQRVTREMVRYTNEILNNLAGSENDEFVVAGDTDSVSGESLITINGIKFSIEEIYELFNFKEFTTEFGKIKNIYKAKIKTVYLVNKFTGVKEQIKLIDNHLLVYREGEIIEISFDELRKTDKIVKL